MVAQRHHQRVVDLPAPARLPHDVREGLHGLLGHRVDGVGDDQRDAYDAGEQRTQVAERDAAAIERLNP